MYQTDPDISFLLKPGSSPPPSGWENFAEILMHHRYFHVLEEVFSLHPDMPSAVKQKLKSEYSLQLHRQLVLAKELQQIAAILNEKELFYINMKGTMLALQLYGKMSERLTRDIDFLVHEADVDRHLEILGQLDYEIIGKEQGKPEKKFRKIKKNYTLINRQKGVIIELHWGLFSNPGFYPGQSRLWEAPLLLELDHIPVRIMNPENTFLYLCLHGTYHEYFRLFWLRDIAEILKSWKLDWARIIKNAEKDGSIRMLASSAILAGRLYQIPSPFDPYEKDPLISWIVNHNLEVINRSSLPSSSDRLKRVFYFTRLRREWNYKIECIAGIGKRYFLRK